MYIMLNYASTYPGIPKLHISDYVTFDNKPMKTVKTQIDWQSLYSQSKELKAAN